MHRLFFLLSSSAVAVLSPWAIAEDVANANREIVAAKAHADDLHFPVDFSCQPQPFYGHRKDGKPGRELKVTLNGGKLFDDATAEVVVSGGPTETIALQTSPNGLGEFDILLPQGVGVTEEAQVFVTLKSGKNSIAKQIIVPPKRQWTVYIYPHSHVDVGYTNTQENIEFIHKQNLLKGIELARKTADWPEGSRFVWNPEVTWPIERYLAKATPPEREAVYDAIRKGWIGVDAGYINDNTSVASDEELFRYMAYKDKLEKVAGVKVDSLMQVDVPGMSWGVVPAAAKSGIRYIMPFDNGGDRTGFTNDLNYRPFWWESPDGKSRVLFFQQGSYNPGAFIKGLPYAITMMGQTNREQLEKQLDAVKTNQPRVKFADQYFMPTMQLLETGSAAPFSIAKMSGTTFLAYLKRMEGTPFYPYDIFVMSWAMADNTPIDQDLPEAVRSWNEEYAYPHIVIAGTHTIMSAFENKYGDQIPVLRGDFTEYWTDGLGSAAKQTGMNRHSKERLVQADTLWSMLNPGKPAPRADFDEAWRHVVLASEHTWAYSDPNKQPLQDTILKEKFDHFEQAENRSKELKARALAPVAAKDGPFIGVFNTLSWERSELVTLSAEQSRAGSFVSDETGAAVPSQRLSTGELVFMASNVPAFGSRRYVLSNQQSEFKGRAAIAHNLTLDNGIVRVTLDPATGDVASLVMGDREFVDKQKGGLNSYHYLHGEENGSKASGPSAVKITVKEKGPLVASLLIESKAEGAHRLVREVRITTGSPEVAFDDLVDKIAILKKEGVHFGYAFNLPEARTRVDIPWGVMEVEKDQLKAGNRNWMCFQRWLDMSNADAGVTWASLDAPVFEYGQMSANLIGSALYSPKWIRELRPSSTIYSWALNNHWHTNFPLSQSGLLPFRYRLLPHASGYDAAAANRFGTAQAQPLVATLVKGNVDAVAPVTLDNPRVVVTILRTEEDGRLNLHLRSLSDRPEKTIVTYNNGHTKEVNLGPLGMETLETER